MPPRRWSRGAEAVGIPIVVTEQYPKGLGETVPEVAEQLPTASRRWRRSASPPPRPTASTSAGRDQALVCGIETHVCVNQTVLDLLASGIEVHVAEDAVGSRFAETRSGSGLQKMEQAGAVLTSVETALFELLGRAGTDEFKAGAEADPGVRPEPGRRGKKTPR